MRLVLLHAYSHDKIPLVLINPPSNLSSILMKWNNLARDWVDGVGDEPPPIKDWLSQRGVKWQEGESLGPQEEIFLDDYKSNVGAYLAETKHEENLTNG